MDTFNPRILDACIRDVSSYLSDSQKVDLLLYVLRSLSLNSRSGTVFENAIQSCLQVPTLSPETIAKARMLRARSRLTCGAPLGAQEDLQAALAAEPDNVEAKALLHQRSVTIEKLLAPILKPTIEKRLSTEIWREIAIYLSRRDLKALFFVSYRLSRIASQLLFREINLYLSGTCAGGLDWESLETHENELANPKNVKSSADILTCIVTNSTFANVVRTLRIYTSQRETSTDLAFQTGMLTNALRHLVNLKNVHITASSDVIMTILRIVRMTTPRLAGLSLRSPEAPVDSSFADFSHLVHFAYVIDLAASPLTAVFNLIFQNRTSLRSISLQSPNISPHWIFPLSSLSIRNLTKIHFTGHFPANSDFFAEILSNGHQLEALDISCCVLECSTVSSQFRCIQHMNALPFLRHFALSIKSLGRRIVDRDLFPAVSEFLRGRKHLHSLQLIVHSDTLHHAVGFDAAIWGVLPSLAKLEALRMSYPPDLSPGLASWLIPRTVSVLDLIIDENNSNASEPVPFLKQLRQGVPPSLQFIGFSDINLRDPSALVEHGFPMVHVVRLANNYWTIVQKQSISSSICASFEMEQWPKRRVQYHTVEWLEWLGCEGGALWDPSAFIGSS